MKKSQIIEVLKANCYVGESANGKPIYEFAENDIEVAAEEIEFKSKSQVSDIGGF